LNNKDLNKAIEDLFSTTLEVMNSGKEEIKSMVMDIKDDYARKIMELSEIQEKLLLTIEEVDSLSIEEKRSRKRLVEVSNDFKRFDESDIKEAYEQTHNLRSRLEIKKQEEILYINRRRELELGLKRMLNNIDKGEKTIDKLGKIAEYIEGNKKDINDTLGDINKIQMFGIKVIEAQEEERKRISRDIHDGPAQDMANIMLRAEYCEKMIDRDLDKAKCEIRELKIDVKNTLDNIRKIIYDLRPMSLDDLGLIPTIEKYIEEFKLENSLNVEFKHRGEFDGLNTGIETAIYRVVQEAFNNIKKHSKARNVAVDFQILEGAKRNIMIKIEDDGVGFSESHYKDKIECKSCGFGIVGMKERVEVLEGKFSMDSRENMGTIIKISIPIIEEGRLN
jgi:two-component system, NarL family, sensor histidine kinase DegS